MGLTKWFRCRYRVVRDVDGAYIPQFRRWWCPVWMSCMEFCRKFGTLDEATKAAERHSNPVVSQWCQGDESPERSWSEDDIADEDVENVEEAVGMGVAGWDNVSAKEIIAASLNVMTVWQDRRVK